MEDTPKDTPKPTPKPATKQEPTEAELKLKEEAELAKIKLIEEIKQFKTDDEVKDAADEPEDPRV